MTSITSSVGAPVGAGVAGGVTYFGVRHVVKSHGGQNFFSVAGVMQGERFAKLPILPKIVTGMGVRNAAEQFVSVNPHLAELPQAAKNFLIDGVATRAGVRLNDPNKMLDLMEGLTDTGVDAATGAVGLLVPHFGQSAGEIGLGIKQAIQLTRTEGVRSINATMAAGGFRHGSRLIPILAGLGAAVGGAILGADLTTPPIKISTPSLNIQRNN